MYYVCGVVEGQIAAPTPWLISRLLKGNTVADESRRHSAPQTDGVSCFGDGEVITALGSVKRMIPSWWLCVGSMTIKDAVTLQGWFCLHIV